MTSLTGAGATTCPACGAGGLKSASVIHHMVCAYVGPDYDFAPSEIGCRCPKCRRMLRDEAHDWEVVGASACCPQCGAEFVVPSARPVAPGRAA